MTRMLNIGCGGTWHPDWTNVDLSPTDASVIAVDVDSGIPFPDGWFDVVYHSHVLEHLPRAAAQPFIAECARVLKSGGILRVVVPDLEAIARGYLQALEECRAGKEGADADYEWMMLELFDQMVRTRPGGEMAQYLAQKRNAEFVKLRIGCEAGVASNVTDNPARSLSRRFPAMKLRRVIRRVRENLARAAAFLVGGRHAASAVAVGLFANRGELHRWMYDRYSLRMLLGREGFDSFSDCDAFGSSIPDYGRYGLDVLDGEIRKPDSLYLEARKP